MGIINDLTGIGASKAKTKRTPPPTEAESRAAREEDERGMEAYCKANPDSDYCYVRPEDRKKAGGKVMRANMKKQMKYKSGGSCGSSMKKYAEGGKVRGNGCCARPKKCKMR